MGNLQTVSIGLIRENPVALRAVNREDERYLGLIESIKRKGFLGAITVRGKSDEETGQEYYELVDGLHRFSAAKDAGLAEINVDIVELTDAETMEAQIMTNIHKVETRPVEYSKQLLRLLSANPLMTEAELAGTLGKSPQWIKERLGLVKITNPEIAELVNEGKIGLANAYALAKLPPEEMADFTDRAMTMSPDEFIPQANARLKEIREAKRQGREASAAEFQPVAHLQKMKDIREALEKGDVGSKLCAGLNTAAEGFEMALKYVLHLDPDSVEAQKAKHEERLKLKEEQKKKRAAEKAKKKAEKAAKAAAEAEAAQKELEESNAGEAGAQG